ncbi:hypothetical protein FCL54_12410 [Pseudalkalibacillus caeni]|uniref:CBS domain-containing protein n=2 Tax=Exobacillus caeni TaxID=2574798 RepID=A0A5R9F063_9BACL|nr:hypothetical protein FCL54_12410 [Pseudalkalibacillus caeni]
MAGYQKLWQLRNDQISIVSNDHKKLNQFHEELMMKVVQIAIDKTVSELGPIPAHFAFFVTGSAGRLEQSIWSDQDHGIIYEEKENCQKYFLSLGKEISKGLEIAGYPLCPGNVMASNPIWCQSSSKWEKQISEWLNTETLESLRYFSTFFDSRVLFGETKLLHDLKSTAFSKLEAEPRLYLRLLENVRHYKKALGPFGQLLPEQHGEYKGYIDLKKAVSYPFVNGLRLLSLKEKISSPSTIERFNQLPSEYKSIKKYKPDFIELLVFQLHIKKDAKDYEDVHLIDPGTMTRDEKHVLKHLARSAHKLFSEVTAVIEKGVGELD